MANSAVGSSLWGSTMVDWRMAAAKYYDACPAPFDDVEFYLKRIHGEASRVLELGCGTGRVLIPLARHCEYIKGLDSSDAMLSICQEKLQLAGIATERTRVELADITDFHLGQRFDLITAPFRVIQNLATDEEVEGLFRCIKEHLSESGTAILNVFKPLKSRDDMLAQWCGPERLNYEIQMEDGCLRRYDRRSRITADPLVCYPDLIYRFYRDEQLIEEAVLSIAMRCYYPDEFISLIESHGFRVIDSWGGYAGEAYGDGKELVVAFGHG